MWQARRDGDRLVDSTSGLIPSCGFGIGNLKRVILTNTCWNLPGTWKFKSQREERKWVKHLGVGSLVGGSRRPAAPIGCCLISLEPH